MKFPNWRWLAVLVAMLLVAQVLVLANILPWVATIVGVFVGLSVYHFFFVAQVKKEADYQADRKQTREANRAARQG